jgi:hypothetical protein
MRAISGGRHVELSPKIAYEPLEVTTWRDLRWPELSGVGRPRERGLADADRPGRDSGRH